MSALQLPCIIYKTQKQMDDYTAADMRFGDLDEAQLQKHFHLTDVSTRVNPYTQTRITPFNHPQSMFYGMRGPGELVSQQLCVCTLFDEFRALSRIFSLYGPYKHVIEQMITHMQNGHGSKFRSLYLDMALKEQILNDRSGKSSLLRIKEFLLRNIDFKARYLPSNKKDELYIDISRRTILPKFDRLKDRINGLGISVHDTWATHITLQSLLITHNSFRAVVHYRIQDHFGLDDKDILHPLYNHIRMFKIWFVLQRWVKYGYKPFITEINATVTIEGTKYD